MLGVILAAGMARRLRPLTDHRPKCLLSVGGRTLVERTVDAMLAAGIDELVVVTGFKAEMLRTFLTEHYPALRIHFIDNPDYEHNNNIFSLWLTRPLTDGRDFLLMDSDIFCEPALVAHIVQQPDTALAVQRHQLGEEEVKVITDSDGYVTEISKTCSIEAAMGESVGIERIAADYSAALFRELEQMIETEGLINVFYELAFERLIPQGHRFRAVDTTRFQSMELDTVEDFERANGKGQISVVINTYNASQHLARVLESVKGFDEIVVCDMESTDDTRDIAASYGCRIVTFPKGNHKSAEPARTFAIQSATSHWVLVVDADELVTPELRTVLYEQIQQPDCPAGLYIPRQNMFLGMFVRDFHYDYQLRFFQREGTTWPPYVHTFPTVQGRVEKLHADKAARLIHLMDETMHEYIDKMNQYTDNEMEKKRDKNYGLGALLWRPQWRFFKKYVMDGSFRMGTRGLIRAMMAAMYQYVLIAKIMERRYREKDASQPS